MSKVNVKVISERHIHDGVEYKKGDVIKDVDVNQAKVMRDMGFAEDTGSAK